MGTTLTTLTLVLRTLGFRLWLPLAVGLVLAKVTAAGAATPGLSPADFAPAPRVTLHDAAGRTLGDTPLFAGMGLVPGDQVTRPIVARNEGSSPATLGLSVEGTGPLLMHARCLQAALTDAATGAVLYQGPLQRLGRSAPVILPPRSVTALRLTVTLPEDAPAELAEQRAAFNLSLVVSQAR